MPPRPAPLPPDPFLAVVGLSATAVLAGLKKSPMVFKALLEARDPAGIVSVALSDRSAPAFSESDPFVLSMRRNLNAARVSRTKQDTIIRDALAAQWKR